VAALTINTVAYTTEIFAGAIRGLPYGEIEAANAYGMSRWTSLRRIILPSALRTSLPTYSNEVIMMLQSTSIVSTITLFDLTGAANNIYSTYYLPFEAFMTAAIVYMALTYLLVRGFRFAERRYLAYQRPQEVK
jgi:arginine/ornithine transport system permease protein